MRRFAAFSLFVFLRTQEAYGDANGSARFFTRMAANVADRHADVSLHVFCHALFQKESMEKMRLKHPLRKIRAGLGGSTHSLLVFYFHTGF